LSKTCVTLAGAVALALCLAGCGNSSESTDSRGGGASAAPFAGTSPSSAPVSAAVLESTDRAVVETVWAKFLLLYPNLITTYPQGQWPARLAEVAVDPIKAQVLTAAAQNRRADVGAYGTVIPHPYWQQPVAGKSTAVMRDCLDASRAGSIFTKTGYKRTVGVARSSIRAYFVKGGDGSWRVRQIEYHVDEKC